MKNIKDIDTETEHGKLLSAAIAKITTESQTDKTPDEVLEQLNDLKRKMYPMTEEQHKQIHVELHQSLDQLFADYIMHHPDETEFTHMPLNRLLAWANEQRKDPTPTPEF